MTLRRTKARQNQNRKKSIFPPVDEEVVNAVWNKAIAGRGIDKELYRKDRFGTWIQRSSFGCRDEFGWDVLDERGAGEGSIQELEPIHWRNKQLQCESVLQCNFSESTEKV